MTRHSTPSGLLRNLRIAGYCSLGAIALALFVAMCAILKDSALDREAVQRLPNDSTELHGGADADSAAATGEPTRTPAARTPG
ncbi:hypothetical protein [Burkholderia alba]|uniref:hypothetical protein n=1 Tax=Burkholderia alba TaxID=2683677 RepID=UPI002B05CDDA|nr:hypothetical protein [Burkholderia alba]